MCNILIDLKSAAGPGAPGVYRGTVQPRGSKRRVPLLSIPPPPLLYTTTLSQASLIHFPMAALFWQCNIFADFIIGF
jgi:hypothetical protein